MTVVAEGTLNEADSINAKWLHLRRPTLLMFFLLYGGRSAHVDDSRAMVGADRR
jgi:hypothetical protein